MERLIGFLRDFFRDTAGVALIYVLITLFALMGAAAVAIDGAYAVYTQTRLQNAADASSLAGAALIPENTGTLATADKEPAVNEAISFAAKNMPASQHGNVLRATDVEFGHWDVEGDYGAARTFYVEGSLPGGANINSVRTTTRRSSSNGNPLDMFLVSIFGNDQMQITASAIAIAPPGGSGAGCATAGFVALGESEGGSQNTFLDGWCLHGEEGVKLGSQNCIEGGPDADDPVIISMPNPGAGLGNGGYDFGSDNEVVNANLCNDGLYDNNELPNEVETATIASYYDPLQSFFFDLNYEAGHSNHIQTVRNEIDAIKSEYPSGWTVNPPSTSDIDINSDVSNQVFITTKNIKVGSGVKLNNVFLWAEEKVTVGSDSELNNAFLLAKLNVEIGSNVTVGDDDFCNTPTGDVNLILGGEQIKMGSNVPMTNVQMIAGNYVDWGSNNIAVGAVSVLSGGNLKFGSNWETRGCDGANLSIDFGPKVSDEPLKLVN